MRVRAPVYKSPKPLRNWALSTGCVLPQRPFAVHLRVKSRRSTVISLSICTGHRQHPVTDLPKTCPCASSIGYVLNGATLHEENLLGHHAFTASASSNATLRWNAPRSRERRVGANRACCTFLDVDRAGLRARRGPAPPLGWHGGCSTGLGRIHYGCVRQPGQPAALSRLPPRRPRGV